MAFQKIT